GPATTIAAPPVEPTRIFALFGPGRFDAYRDALIGRRLEKTGIFASNRFGNTIVFDASRSDSRPILAHELAHLWVNAAFNEAPLWLSEGLAELFESSEILGDQVVLGEPEPQVTALLRREPLMPMKILLTTREGEGREGGSALFYAQSWALVHYLLASQDWSKRLEDYLERLRSGEPELVAFEDAFGLSPEALDRKLTGYVNQPRLPVVAVPVDERTRKDLRAEQMTSSDVLSELGALLVDLGDADTGEAHAFLEKALDLDEENALAHAAMGTLLESRDEIEAAAESYDRALSIDPVQHRARLALDALHETGNRKVAEKGPQPPRYLSVETREAIERLHHQAKEQLASAEAEQERERLRRIIEATRPRSATRKLNDLYEDAIALANAQQTIEAIALLDDIIAGTREDHLLHVAAKELRWKIRSQRGW
ncbi:MAG: hypothetical protein R3338_14745, partial [Thermoanaerobaculia bacterium]|nr:hypothetical protein [Thermoanaerobaculia bacterium]